MIARLIGLCAVFSLTLGSAHADGKQPRVLIITDSILRSFLNVIPAELNGRANVVVSATDLGNTGVALDGLDKLLGDTKWDLIHFNFGFADLLHVDPKTKSFRIMSRHAGGVRVTNPEQYEANLRKIVARLKSTDAKLIWASTTPLVGTKYDHLYETGSEQTYNAIAAEIMHQEKVPVNDLHAWVLANVKKFTDPFAYKRVPIHEPIIVSIEKVLKLQPKPKKPADAKKK